MIFERKKMFMKTLMMWTGVYERKNDYCLYSKRTSSH